jgi:hypothetical protein
LSSFIFNISEISIPCALNAEFAALVKKYGMEVISSHARAKFDVKDAADTLASRGKYEGRNGSACKKSAKG